REPARPLAHLPQPVRRVLPVRAVARRRLHVRDLGPLSRHAARARARLSRPCRGAAAGAARLGGDVPSPDVRLGPVPLARPRRRRPVLQGAGRLFRRNGRLLPVLLFPQPAKGRADAVRPRLRAGAARALYAAPGGKPGRARRQVGGFARRVPLFGADAGGEQLQSVHLLPVLSMRRLKVAYVLAFFALTVLPVLQWAVNLVDISALDEKRRLAP